MKKNKKIKILFLDILTGDKKIKKDIENKVYQGGTYGEHIRKIFGLSKKELVVLDGSKNISAKPSKYDAIIMGGSVENPVKNIERPWMKKVYKFILEAIDKNVPILGICGGLQFVVRALGGEIIPNSKGREFGSVNINITQAGMRDRLFRGLPKNIIIQSSHKCILKGLRSKWTLLASSNLCDIQAIAIGKNIRLLQFHPEMISRQIKALAQMRKEPLLREGFVGNEKEFKEFLSSIKNTEKTGKKILQNFIKYFVV